MRESPTEHADRRAEYLRRQAQEASRSADRAEAEAIGTRRLMLRKAREGIEATPLDQWDETLDEALAGIKRAEAQLTPEPITAQEAIEVFVEIVRAAGLLLEETGTSASVALVHEPIASKLRAAAEAFPGMYLRPETGPADPRAEGHDIPDGWICTVGGIDVYECQLPRY